MVKKLSSAKVYYSEIFKICPSAKVNSCEISKNLPPAKVSSRKMHKFRGSAELQKFLPAKVSSVKVSQSKISMFGVTRIFTNCNLLFTIMVKSGKDLHANKTLVKSGKPNKR